jgi:hypothetical protein
MQDRTVTVDAWVKDGALTEVSVDLAQFTGASTTPVPLTVTFVHSGGDITRPSGATPVDLTKLSSLMGALSS